MEKLEDNLRRAPVQPRNDHRAVIKERGKGVVMHGKCAGTTLVDNDTVVECLHKLHKSRWVEDVAVRKDILGLRECQERLDEVVHNAIDDKVDPLARGLPDAIAADIAAVVVFVVLALGVHDALAALADMVLALMAGEHKRERWAGRGHMGEGAISPGSAQMVTATYHLECFIFNHPLDLSA